MAWETLAAVSAGGAISAAYHNQVRENIEHLAGLKFADVALSALAAGTSAARIAVGSYTGNGSDNRQITGVGFTPKFVLIKRADANPAVWRFGIAGDASFQVTATGGSAANYIQSLDSDGFTIGTDISVNNNTSTFYYVAIG